jgi:hypothetical protein
MRNIGADFTQENFGSFKRLLEPIPPHRRIRKQQMFSNEFFREVIKGLIFQIFLKIFLICWIGVERR